MKPMTPTPEPCAPERAPYRVIAQHDVPSVPVKAWTVGVELEAGAQEQLERVARLPFIHKWVAAMPDVHWGLGATVGSVIPTRDAIIPAAVGVDIGCGMIAVETTLSAAELPDSLAGVRAAMSDGRTVLVDVYPPKGAGPDPLDGTWRNSETRQTIPGAVWLPEVGRGFLADDYEAYFRRNLAAPTGGDLNRPLLFFCTADCWQGWNAARRAILWGHGAVSWYPGGTDQWVLDGGAVTTAEPVNFLNEPK